MADNTKRSFRLANGTTMGLEFTDTRCIVKSSRVVLEAPETLTTVAVLTVDDARELGLYLGAFITNAETAAE